MLRLIRSQAIWGKTLSIECQLVEGCVGTVPPIVIRYVAHCGLVIVKTTELIKLLFCSYLLINLHLGEARFCKGGGDAND